MNFFPTLLNLLDFPSTVQKEITGLLNHSINNDQDACDLDCRLSNETRQIFIESLTTKPYETSIIIQTLRDAYKLKHNKTCDDLISITIENYIEFIDDVENQPDSNKTYSLLSMLKFCDDQNLIQKISPKIDVLVKENKLNKDMIYLSLFSQNNILKEYLKYEKECFNKCNLNDSSSLFRYSSYKNRHWLFHIIEYDIDDINLINNSIICKLFFLKLNYFINIKPINITHLNKIILKISEYKTTDIFLNTFIKEITWNINFYQYITKINPNIEKTFQLCELKSCLDILSSYVNLNDMNLYENINEILIQHEHYLSESRSHSISELDLYNGFCILTLIEYYITHDKNDSFLQNRFEELFKKSKQQLLKSRNIDFQLEILENIFTILFLKTCETETNFLCGKKEIHYISTLLKKTLKEIKRKLPEEKKSLSRFTKLQSYVHDTLWRLDFLNSLNTADVTINIMLSSSNTLIYLCLAHNNFEKAHDVIQEYKLEETEIAKEIEYLERLKYLKCEEKITSEEIIKFCSGSKLIQTDIFKNTFTKFSENKYFKNISSDNEIFMNIIDVILTSNNIEINKELFNKQEIPQNEFTCSYMEFCCNLRQIFNHFDNKLSVYEILFSQLPLNMIELERRERYFKDLETTSEEFKQLLPAEKSGTYNNEEICQSYLKLVEICSNESNYLYKLYKYLKHFVKLLYIKKDNNYVFSEEKEDCIFNLLYIYPSKIVTKLLINKLYPNDFEHHFANLNLDIIYHISWNCLPEIDLRSNVDNKVNNLINNNNFKDFLQELKQMNGENIEMNILFTPNIYLLSYIRKRNWLLAYLINKVHLIEEAKPDKLNSDRTKYFNNFLSLPSIQTLQKIFDNNPILTAFYYEIPLNKILSHFETTDWNDMLDILNCLPEVQLLNDKNLITLRDMILYNLVNEGKTVQDWRQVEWINNNDLKVECISKNMFIWPGNFCTEILNNQLSNYSLNTEQKNKLQTWYSQINLYENIKIHFNLECWNDIYEKSKQNLKEVFLLLLTSKQINLLLKWIEIENCTNFLHLITTDYFLLIIEENVELNSLKTLLDILNFDQKIQICKELIKDIRKPNYLEFIINYLVTLLPELENEYKNYIISLKILTCFNPSEHEYMFCLINKPLLILEQLIMNVRLEKLSAVLEKISPILKSFQDKNISTDVSLNSIDLLLRNYAEKTLDFRGIQPSNGLRNLELKLMQSLDTVSDTSVKKIFVMPEKVPDKKDWIENEKALECMCCREVTFSMFNRRHHCRRCGRVVCGNCSHKRLEIPEYGSIPVRVCNDCFKYSTPEEKSSLKSEQSSNKSGSLVAWLLTDDEKHNDIVREEFSYEYAPSVSLCLSILKSHSTSVEYARFLLEQSKILLPYLQDSVSEIDFSFVIQMIKSLVTVAKVTSLHNSYKAELSQCNEILLHVELLKLLVEKDCLELLRSANKNSSDFYIDSGVLRRLRDKLIEQEQWPLALDICTKVGLDKTGIFAAWGKSYLKAGCLQLAREKFQYCLEKHYDTSDLSISLDPDDFRNKKSVTLSTVSETRSIKTPPLVNEIISVLESNGKICDKSVFKTFEKICLNASTLSLNTNCGTSVDPAVCILNKLKNLNTITGQNHKRKISKTSMPKFYIEPCFYNECLYYLTRYGSHYSILQFYIRHDEIDDALNYILENRIQTDIFIEIYMKCLENGKIEILQEHMSKIDITLNIWENYLKAICRHLETNSMFNILYQLQIFMNDYVRASMTCIKFYQENVNSFRELLEREEYLQKAQAHLKQELEAEQWVQISSDRKHSTGSSGSSLSKKSYEISLTLKIDPRNIDKYINTIWRQIEATKFLAECEMENRPTLQVLNEIFTLSEGEKSNNIYKKIPTLFDSQLEKIKLAVLMVVCGKNVEEGFGIAFRIIQEQNLKYLKVYCLAGKYLAQTLRDDAVTELINCIQSSGLNTDAVNETCDEVLITAVSALTKANATGAQLENLIKLINDSSIKIDAYIESKQLKRAYLLAIRYNKISDIKKILKEADRLNQPQIKAICLKKLNPTS